ncbi:MAG TPA: hypothetical protein VG842_05335 [Sediminibacterium sp.]|nr:hypothetical protein [Sediminibacterium sp.]
MYRIAGVLFLLCMLVTSRAQQFGGTPATVHWQQIKTDTVQIIFPRGYAAQARRISSIVHSLQRRYAQTIGDAIKPVSIIIRNQSLVSNGYVGLAPYRSEWYTTPPQHPFGLGAVRWTDNLALHEFRHAEQYSNFNKGLSHLARWFLGAQGQLVANAAAVPDWFFEGDAVFNETRFSRQGRGTLPLFLNGYQSLYLARKQYSYQKLRNGSFRDYVPDHYQLGYLLVAYGREKYGDNFWRDVTADAVAFHPLIYPFQGALQKKAGIRFRRFVQDAFHFYEAQWKSSDTGTVQWISPVRAKTVTNDQYPYPLSDGSSLVLRTGYDNIPAFYRIDQTGRSSRVAARAIATEGYYGYNNGRIVYAADEPDIRWGDRAYRTIRVISLANGREKVVLRHTRYQSPDIAHHSDRLLVVQSGLYGGSAVYLLDQAGRPLDSVVIASGVYSTPKFAVDDQSFYVVQRDTAGNMALLKYRLNHHRQADTLLLPFNRLIDYVTVQGDTIYCTVTYKGRDEIWAVIDRPEYRGPFRLASYPSGIYQAYSKPGGLLVGSVFTAAGYRLMQVQPAWQRVEQKDELKPLYVGSAYPPGDHSMLANIPERQDSIAGYHQATRLFNFHSFRPYYSYPEYSFTVYGENVLNTFQSQLAYTYNSNEKSQALGYTGKFGGSYLQPVVGVKQTWSRAALYQIDTSLGGSTTLHWNETEAFAGLQLPLNLSGGRFYRNLLLSGAYHLDQVSWYGIATKIFTGETVAYGDWQISYAGQIQQPLQRIYPAFAESFYLRYRHNIGYQSSRQFLASGALYLPGIGPNHSLVLKAAWQARDTLMHYLYSNGFPFSRGYLGTDFPRMWMLGFNYHLPLAYPEAGIANLVYLLRVRLNVFGDATWGRSLRTGSRFLYRSIGAECMLDTRWWNQQPVSLGIRYSRLLDNGYLGPEGPNIWELILPVTIFN